MAEERADRRLAAIFASDIAGYSRLIVADEERTLLWQRKYKHRPDLARSRREMMSDLSPY
jgi:hypothetical protein